MRSIIVVILAFTLTGCGSTMSKVEVSEWGSIDGKPVHLYTLDNGKGMTAKLSDFGATIVQLHVPDRTGKTADVVLGFDRVESYNGPTNQYLGSSVGRSANRIAKGKFTLDGKQYTLAVNNGPNHLHGGERGFSHHVWTAKTFEKPGAVGVRFSRLSPDGEEGYPGNLNAEVVYTLTKDNEVIIEHLATTDAPTIGNIAHHSYYNLAGHESGSVLDQLLELECTTYTAMDDTLIPTGEIKSVAGTPYDFTTPVAMGARIATFKTPEFESTGGGYDLNYIIDGEPRKMRKVATVTDPKSGRVMTLESNMPALQFYTGNWLKGQIGKGGVVYQQHGGICLETQFVPDAINQSDKFASPILRPGETFRHVMVLKFTTTK